MINKVQQLNEVKSRPQLRYPKFELRMFHDNMENSTTAIVYTYVSNKGRCLKVEINHKVSQEFDNNAVNTVIKALIDKCEHSFQYHLFDNDSTVYEPYDFNKI